MKWVGTCAPRRELEKGKMPTPWEVPHSSEETSQTEEELWSIGKKHSNLCKAIEMEMVLYKWSVSLLCTSQPRLTRLGARN